MVRAETERGREKSEGAKYGFSSTVLDLSSSAIPSGARVQAQPLPAAPCSTPSSPCKAAG